MTCITAACKNPDKAAAFVDFMVSEEGNNLLRLGIEGIHYTKDGDEIVFNEEERARMLSRPMAGRTRWRGAPSTGLWRATTSL